MKLENLVLVGFTNNEQGEKWNFALELWWKDIIKNTALEKKWFLLSRWHLVSAYSQIAIYNKTNTLN